MLNKLIEWSIGLAILDIFIVALGICLIGGLD